MSPLRALALAPALLAALATPAAAAAPHVTDAYVYFHTYANKKDRKFNLGTVELVYRTDGPVPQYPETRDPKIVPTIGGNQGSSYAISRALHCYGATVYADKQGDVMRHESGLPGHTVMVRIPALGYSR